MGGYHQNKTMRLDLSKQQVWEAYKKVKANQGTYGVDEVDWKQFDARLKQNLYTLWNRLSSGSYYPKAVRRVSIPKSNGSVRGLGIPTLTDRIAQEVLRSVLAPYVEPHFHADSYAYQTGKNAHHAIGQCRYRTNYYSWLIDLDIKGYFENIPHDKLMQAVDVNRFRSFNLSCSSLSAMDCCAVTVIDLSSSTSCFAVKNRWLY